MVDPKCQESTLSDLRGEIIDALSMFHDHVKYTITFMTTVLAIAIAFPVFAIENDTGISATYFCVGASILFLSLIPISNWALRICHRGYLVYASNYIYYARQHLKSGNEVDHPWVHNLIDVQGITEEELFTAQAVLIFMESKKTSEPNSWHYYQKLLRLFKYISAAGFVCGLLLAIVMW